MFSRKKNRESGVNGDMRTFSCTMKQLQGLHARNAMQFAKQAEKYSCQVRMDGRGDRADAKDVMSLMRLAVRQGDIITVAADGSDEEAAAAELEVLAKEIF